MIKQISQHVYYMEPEDDCDRPVIGYIRGSRYAFAVEAGASKAHVDKFYKELTENGLPLPDFTGITHYHWDHSYGAWACRGVTIATDKTNEILREEAAYEWTEAAVQQRIRDKKDIMFCYLTRLVEYPENKGIKVVPADMEISGDTVIDLGGVHVKMIVCGGPHSEDAMMFLVPEDKLLFLGDAHSKDFFKTDWTIDREHLCDLLEILKGVPHFMDRLVPFVKLIEAIDFETAVFGHYDGVITRSELLDSLYKECNI